MGPSQLATSEDQRMGQEGEWGDGWEMDEGPEMGQGPGRRDDESGSTSDSEDLIGPSEDEGDEESDEGEISASGSVDWVEVRGSAEYAIEGFAPGLVGVNHTLDTTATPLAVFNLIFDESFFESIVDETNRYARQSLAAD